MMFTSCASNRTNSNAISILRQGNFTAGGIVKTSEGTFDPTKPWYTPQGGQTLHGDHAAVIYQIPVNAKKLPLVFLPGYGQTGACFGTTADGREGFQSIFLRRDFSVYLVDQPRRARAAQTTEAETNNAVPSDQTWYTQFRIGLWPEFYDGVQFPKDDASLNNFFRMMVPAGNADQNLVVDDMAAVFEKTGPAILVSHSAGGMPGFLTAIKSKNVRAIVAYEPGGEPWPADAITEKDSSADPRPGTGISAEDFSKLCKIPIVFYYGDNIPDKPTGIPSKDFWLASLNNARKWAALVNSRGGNATVVHLPDVGLKGNTHFMFSDLNNVQVADLLSSWLHEKGLDK
jgi:pimeloyl-ACP methyl ester carboxylesterase